MLAVYNRVSARPDTDIGREGEVRATATWIAEKLVKINATRKQQKQAVQLGDEASVDDDLFAGLLLEEEQVLLDVYNRVSARRGTATGRAGEMLPTTWIAEKLVQIHATSTDRTQAARLGSRCDERSVDDDDELAGLLLEEEQALLDVYNRVSARRGTDMSQKGEMLPTPAWIADKLVKINASRKQQKQAVADRD